MNINKPKILIGFINKDNKGAIPTITKAFIDGLSDKYNFIPFYKDRKYGKNKTSNLNILNIYYLIKHYIKWVYLILKYKPDIVHYPITSYWNLEKSILFLTTAKKLGVKKTIGHLHGGYFLDFLGNLNPMRMKIAFQQLKRVDCLIVLSDYWKNSMNMEVDIDKIYVVNNPIDNDFENYFDQNINNTLNSDILFVGSIGKGKGVYDIIESMKYINSNFRLRLIGPEDRKNDIKNIKRLIIENDLQDDVTLMGCLYGKEKYEIFQQCGIFLFPSYNENFPLVIIEAACAGLAIITTPVGAIPEFFEHNKSVIFVEPGNIEQIKNAVVDLLNSPEKRRRLGKEARKVFLEKLSRDKIMKSLDNVYQSVLREN